MASVDESDKFGSFSMQIVDVKYRKKNNIKCSGRKRWCLLLIVLLMIAVVAGVTVGILKAIQSSESSGTSKQEQNSCYQTKCTSTPTLVAKGSSSMESISSSRTSYRPIPTSSDVLIGSSSMENSSPSMENISPSRTSYPVPTSSEVLIETSWSTWQGWSVCSTSCGGGMQTRKRMCGKPNIPNVIANCFGSNVLYRNCSTWKCPDCTKPCPIGYLNSACDACVCTNVTVNGTVRNEDGVLLNNATIALSEFPFNILARTDIAGHFKLRAICIAQEKIIVERNGYLPQVLNAKKIDSTSFTISASLEAIVFPEVTVHPESKIRVENQTMTLCCVGVGKPDIKYEWILNGRSVSEYQQDESESSKLIIPRLHRSMNGEVKCKVYNDHGAEFSNAAKITVITKKDSCNEKPLQEMFTLPPVCVDEETNSSIVDVGRCGDESCISNSLFSLHNCSDNYCCQSLAEKSIVIRCFAGASFNMTRITSCGCGRCSPKVSTVNGIATGGPNNLPFKYGYIYHAGKYLTQAGKNGEFFFTMRGDLTRIVLNFKGKDRHNDFQDLTKVLPVVPGRETFVNVRMKPRPQPMLINASETIEIPMGSSNSSEGQSAPVVLSLPPQSLMTEDGEIYNGTANLEVSFTDPRNETQVQEADGDFTAISDDGEQQLLETFGVFKINFMDSNGRQLQSNAPVDVNLDLDEYNITEKVAEKIKLWYMDEKTGRWRIMDSGLKPHESRRSKRSGRKFYFGRIDHTLFNRLTNLDQLGNMCSVKIRVDNIAVAATSQSVKITVVSRQGGLNRYLDYSMLAGASSCIQTFCQRLTIRAAINQKILKPNDKNIDAALKQRHGITYHKFENAVNRFSNRITIQDISNPTSGGPFFSDSNSCSNGLVQNSLIFDVFFFGGSGISPGDIKWHKEKEQSVCYVKITTENSCRNKNVWFYVNSTNTSKNPLSEGFTIVSIAKLNISTCAEFKCPTSKNRNVFVIVTPLVGGQFNATAKFKTVHDEGNVDKVFAGKVASFRPKYKLNDPDVGVIYSRSYADVHNILRERECGSADTTAGLRFNCA